MTKVCHLTTVHQPFDVRIFQKECRSLSRAGYDVSLVAVHDKDETVDGVRILALPKPQGRWERWTQTRENCLRRAADSGAELFHFHDPELIPVGLELKKRGMKVVYDVHESHAESILDRAYLSPILRRPMSWQLARLERKADGLLDAVVAATPKIARSFKNPHTVLVQNYPAEGELVTTSNVPMSDRDPVVGYVGGVSLARGVMAMVMGVTQVPGVRLVVVGEFSPPTLPEDLEKYGDWGRVDRLGWRDRAGVAEALSRCLAGIVLYLPLRNHVESQPNKLFEYMSAGLPVIASDFPHWREILEGEGCGIVVDPYDPDAVAGAVRSITEDRALAQAMGDSGKRAVREKYNWTTQEAVLLELYGSMTTS